MFAGNARAEISHEELHSIFSLARSDQDLASTFTILQRIVDQISKYLVDRVSIDRNRRHSGVHDGQIDTATVSNLLECLHGFIEQLLRCSRLQLETALTRLDTRKNQ